MRNHSLIAILFLIYIEILFFSQTLFIACSEKCAPQCNNKQCGDDGCGGSCGECIGYESCSQDGVCISDYEEECNNMVNRMDECGVEIKGKSYDQLLLECKQLYNDFHQCLSNCNTSTEGCSHFFACAYVCGGGSKEQLCDYIMNNVYDICSGGGGFVRPDGSELSKQEAYDACVSDFEPIFYCAYGCLVGSNVCADFWSCMNSNC